jgi:hypothetical protein
VYARNGFHLLLFLLGLPNALLDLLPLPRLTASHDGVLLHGVTANSPSLRRASWPAGRIACGKTRFSTILIGGWRLVRLAHIDTEQAPNPRGHGTGRPDGELFCWGFLLDGSDYDGEQDEDEDHDSGDREEQDGEH